MFAVGDSPNTGRGLGVRGCRPLVSMFTVLCGPPLTFVGNPRCRAYDCPVTVLRSSFVGNYAATGGALQLRGSPDVGPSVWQRHGVVGRVRIMIRVGVGVSVWMRGLMFGI